VDTSRDITLPADDHVDRPSETLKSGRQLCICENQWWGNADDVGTHRVDEKSASARRNFKFTSHRLIEDHTQ
jgi:hypothetical protein